MKKVFSAGLGVLVCLLVSLPVTAEDGSSSVFQEIYAAIATWIVGGSDLEALPASTSTQSGAQALSEENLSSSESGGPPATTEMSPMTFPGG